MGRDKICVWRRRILWTYQGEPFTSADIGDYVGFVYIIRDRHTNRAYIGKKTFSGSRRSCRLDGSHAEAEEMVVPHNRRSDRSGRLHCGRILTPRPNLPLLLSRCEKVQSARRSCQGRWTADGRALLSGSQSRNVTKIRSRRFYQ